MMKAELTSFQLINVMKGLPGPLASRFRRVLQEQRDLGKVVDENSNARYGGTAKPQNVSMMVVFVDRSTLRLVVQGNDPATTTVEARKTTVLVTPGKKWILTET
jgi:hypothetical protein